MNKKLPYYQKIDEIKHWLHEMEIRDYEIITDDSKNKVVDVYSNVNLFNELLPNIPVKFNVVKGNFNIGKNYLTDLHNCPNRVEGDFMVHLNHQLKTLFGGPDYVGGDYDCTTCSNLWNLEGMASYIGKNLIIKDVDNMITLQGFPEKVKGDVYLSCDNLITGYIPYNPVVSGKFTGFKKLIENPSVSTNQKDIQKYIEYVKDISNNKNILLNSLRWLSDYSNINPDFHKEIVQKIHNLNKETQKKYPVVQDALKHSDSGLFG